MNDLLKSDPESHERTKQYIHLRVDSNSYFCRRIHFGANELADHYLNDEETNPSIMYASGGVLAASTVTKPLHIRQYGKSIEIHNRNIEQHKQAHKREVVLNLVWTDPNGGISLRF